MILIADSGGTKTSWRYISADGAIKQAQTTGFNPYHNSTAALEKIITDDLLPQVPDIEIEKVFFYGAGCSSGENVNSIAKTISGIFPGAKVEVNHDLLAAARGLCGANEGIACILGTGANSCYFDGYQIIRNEPSLGYILGDEGGGAYLGKQLLVAFVRKELPDTILERLEKRFALSKDEILSSVYQGDAPARYLSSFSKFIFQNLNNPELHHLVYDSLKLFFEKNVMKYERYQQIPVHFTGSVAFYYANILRQVAADLGINVRNITEDPIAGLTLYHQNQLQK